MLLFVAALSHDLPTHKHVKNSAMMQIKDKNKEFLLTGAEKR
jgi:hypothetical protein